MNLYKTIIKLLLLSVTFSVQSGQPIASINGSACKFNTISAAIAAAQPNDVINIKGGTHAQLIGEISINLTLVASRGATGCEIGDSIFATIDGLGQTFDSTGGLVKITNGAKVTFRDMALINASAINGGIMAVVDGSSVTLDNVVVINGSALSAGGNVYVSAGTGTESTLVINNGSTIYSGTVVTGDGGGIALYNSKLIINEGVIGLMGINQGNLTSNNGGGIYAENSSLMINNFDSRIQNNQSDNFGGGIYALDSTVFINDATVNDNTAEINGGGVYLENTNLTLTDATISNNVTTEFIANAGGAGLYLTGSSQAIIDLSTILSNTSETLGGGILSVGNSASVTIRNGSDIINNTARSGAGIFSLSPLSIDSSSIRYNTTSGSGGGIRCLNCQNLSIESSQISNNTAASNGGGLAIFTNQDTSVEIRNSSFTSNLVNNTNSSVGGGISQDGGTLLIDSCTISSNHVGENGGGAFLFDLDNVRIINSQFFNNSLPSSDFGRGGGALFLNEILSAHISGSNFNVNNSGLEGGAIYVFDSNLIIDESIISQNNAVREGGGIYAEDSDLVIRNSSIIQNGAIESQVFTPGSRGGGGIKAMNTNLDLFNSKVNQNTSGDVGGGIFYDGSINNTLSIQSQYGVLANECLPSALGFNEYCSEVSNNTAIFGAGLMIRGSTNEQGINLSGVALNGNSASDSFSTVNGVAIDIEISNPLDTEVTMENLIVVENEGFSDLNKSTIFTSGNLIVSLLSSTIANNTVRPFRAGTDNSAVVVQNSLIHQNDSGPLVPSAVSFIGLCNNSEMAESGGQSFGANLGDPQFISTSRGDYRLSSTSPSVDACSFGALLDIDGNVRPNGNSNYDQGAFEMNANFVVAEIFMSGFE